MTEALEQEARPTDPVGRILYRITRVVALAGGGVLALMSVLTTVSVIGRSLFSVPIPGDFELIAIGTGVSVFAFLPHCQLVRGNVFVDFFMDRAPVPAKTFFDAVGNLLLTLIIALMIWRTSLGGIDMFNVGETTMILGVPIWWTIPLAIACLALLLVVCVYTLGRSILETRAKRFL